MSVFHTQNLKLKTSIKEDAIIGNAIVKLTIKSQAKNQPIKKMILEERLVELIVCALTNASSRT